MSVLTDGYNCENKNVRVRGEESKLITKHRERAGWHGIRTYTTLRLTAVRVKTLSAVSSVACRGARPKSRPQLGYMGYKFLAVSASRH